MDSLRVMSLHALAYCERLFYLEEVENIRVADARVYAGRRLHVELERDEEGDWHTLELESEAWGLRGKVDCLRRRSGEFIPYEHKRGRSARSADGEAQAWPSDRVQLIAYAALVAEHTGRTINEGRIRYHADNVTVRVALDDAAFDDLRRAIQRARDLQSTVERPPVTPNERLCVKCSLAPVCLPEEARWGTGDEGKNGADEGMSSALPRSPALPLAHSPTRPLARSPLRLFPADDHRTVLHVLTQGAQVGRQGDRLQIAARDEPATVHPVNEVGQVVLHGFAQITTQALRLCAEKEVGVHWVTTGGQYLGAYVAGAGSVQRRVRQYRALTDDEFCLRLARRLAEARVRGQLSFLLRAARDGGRGAARDIAQDIGHDAAGEGDAADADGGEGGAAADASGVTAEAAPRIKAAPEIAAAVGGIRRLLSPLARADSLDSLRGYEGAVGALYFGALPHLVSPEAGAEMKPDGRSRRPPRDRANALLSFGYALLLKDVTNAIIAVGLDPSLGFYHQPRSSAPPLALDLMELFRVPLVDLPVIASINRRQWDAEADFTVAGPQVWLSDAGRRKLIGIYERRKGDHWKHPVIGYSLSYARLLELEVRLLEKEWMNEGGLFARLRLR